MRRIFLATTGEMVLVGLIGFVNLGSVGVACQTWNFYSQTVLYFCLS